jgi:hypothetical protein
LKRKLNKKNVLSPVVGWRCANHTVHIKEHWQIGQSGLWCNKVSHSTSRVSLKIKPLLLKTSASFTVTTAPLFAFCACYIPFIAGSQVFGFELVDTDRAAPWTYSDKLTR